MAPSVQQKFALFHELETAVQLVQTGLRELQRIGGANDFYHLPLLMLANGFERYLKVILCLNHLEQTGEFPSRADLIQGRKGHDLSHLLDRVLAECFSVEYVTTIPVGGDDVEFLRTDARLCRIVRLLSDFGQAARYYHLDLVLGDTPTTASPEDEWAKLETEVLNDRPDLLHGLGKPQGLDAAFAYLRVELSVILERWARALARLFTIGRLGELAQQSMTYVSGFLTLRDDQLGRTSW